MGETQNQKPARTRHVGHLAPSARQHGRGRIEGLYRDARAADKNYLTIALGFSHEIKYAIPAGIEVKCEKPTSIAISGFDKRLVGQVAAEVRALRKHRTV